MPARPLPEPSAPIKRIKILSMGEQAVGKSCLIKRYCEEKFVGKYVTTIGIDYGVKPVQVPGHGSVRVNFWDVAGGDEYFDIRNEFYRDVQGAVLVFDVSSRGTFDKLDSWMKEAASHGAKEPAMLLIGNKTDKKRDVSEAEAKAWASSRDMQYMETSAKDGSGVKQAFEALFTAVCSSGR